MLLKREKPIALSANREMLPQVKVPTQQKYRLKRASNNQTSKESLADLTESQRNALDQMNSQILSIRQNIAMAQSRLK